MVFDTLILNSSTKFLNCFEPAPSRPIESRVWIDTPQYRVTNNFENNFSMGWVKNDMARTSCFFSITSPKICETLPNHFPRGQISFPLNLLPPLLNEMKKEAVNLQLKHISYLSEKNYCSADQDR